MIYKHPLTTPASTAVAQKGKGAAGEPEMALALVVKSVVEQLVIPDPLAGLRGLEEVVEKGWILSSSQVNALIGVVPRGKKFERHGFSFK